MLLPQRRPLQPRRRAPIAYRPSDPAQLAVAAAWRVGMALRAPSSRLHFGRAVTAIDHSEAISAAALTSCYRCAGASRQCQCVDLAGFRLARDRITVAGDWRDAGAKGRFLREVRDGACDLFATVLSPDYNAAHRDHFHLDQAARGAWGWRGCR